MKVKLFGIKNNQITESSYVIYNFDREEQDEFGRLPPFVKYYRYVDDIRFEIVDNESGIASATIEFYNQPDNENFEPIILDEDDISTYYYDQGAFIFTIPIWKIGEAGGIVINAKDKKGNVMPEEFFYPDLNCYGGMHYAYPCQVSVLKWYPSGGHYYADEIHWKIGVSFWENLTGYRNLYLDKWDNSNGCFQNSTFQQLNYIFGNDQEIDFGELNTGFYKVSSSEVFYAPYYFYVGSHSAEWDFLVSNAENNKSVLIQSDAPVYVCTYITNVPYEECVNYDVNFWEEYKRVTDEQIFEFSNSNHDFKSYKIDLNKIPKNYSYVVVAHYADGKKMKSHVYYKDW